MTNSNVKSCSCDLVQSSTNRRVLTQNDRAALVFPNSWSKILGRVTQQPKLFFIQLAKLALMTEGGVM